MTDDLIKKAEAPQRPIWWWIATWFGSGLSPIISGTAGSLAALPFAYVIQRFYGNFALFGAAIAIFFIGWWASNHFLLSGKGTGSKEGDPREIVVDEVAGQWLLLSILYPTWQSYLVGFFLFRLFDIVKPWPVSVADEKIKGGLGVMLDDILAAAYPILVYLILMLEGHLFHGEYLLNPLVKFLGGSYVQ